MENNKVILDLTIHEAEVIRRAISGYTPPKEDEMISIMLYNRIKVKIAETIEKHE